VDIAMDVVAMLTKDLGITVEDDYTNIKDFWRMEFSWKRKQDFLGNLTL